MHRFVITVVTAGFLSTAFSQQASLSGTVTLSDGTTPVESLLVVLENNGNAVGECFTDASGSYTMSINPGDYDQLRVRNQMRRIDGIPYELEHTAKTNVTIADGANSEDIEMPRFFSISGTVLTSAGDTVKGVRIECGQSGGFAPPRDWTTSSESDGSYSLVNTQGDVRITVKPDGVSGIMETAFDLQLSSDTVFNLELPVIASITGVVKNSRGDTLRGIGVTFEKPSLSWQVDSITRADGSYSVALTPGTVNIRIRNGSQMNGAAKGAPARLEATVASDVVIEGDTVINITLPAYPMVRCSVVTGAGEPVEGIIVRSSTGDMPDVPTGDLDTTDANGVGILFVDLTMASNIWIEPPEGSGYITTRETVETDTDTTVVIVLSEGVVLSGTVFQSDSETVVAGIAIALEQGAEQLMVYTDNSGEYTIQLAAGTYRLRVRNTGSQPGLSAPEGVPQSLEHTVFEEIDLTESMVVTIRLPFFPMVSGKVYTAAGDPVELVELRFARWFNGADGPPYCETVTDAAGAFSIVVGAGVNKVKVKPPAGSSQGAFEFIESFDESFEKDIYLPDQAKGITRVQPSVITGGESGKVMINGINVALNDVTEASHLSFGDGVTVDSVNPVSAMTLYAFITIDDDAASGTRDVRVTAPGSECVGPNLLTITAPASAEIELDNNGKTVEEVVIGDGTGTELIIPAGTDIDLPESAEPIISYKAPIIDDAATTAPPAGEYTQVQRELSPAGLVFNDSVVMICQYSDQDVEGIDEMSLKPFIYEEKSTEGSDEIEVVKRDTASNTIAVVVPHFSTVRLASAGGTASRYRVRGVTETGTRFTINRMVACRQTAILLHIAAEDRYQAIRLDLVDLQGRIVRTWVDGKIGAGNHTLIIGARSAANGTYCVTLTAGAKRITKRVALLQ